MIDIILKDFDNYKNEKLATHHTKFFKTAKNEYGEGDMFLGLTIPEIRALSKKYYDKITMQDCCEIICSKYHEIRMFTLFCLIEKMNKNENVIDFYIDNVDYINNWDLVDLSAPKIIGKHCSVNKNYDIIYNFADKKYNKSKKELTNLWCERISVVSTQYLIKNDNIFDVTIKLCEKFLNHKHDLMHKATGWMLREIGKKDEKILCNFLEKYYKIMPRTMLRYSIEKFDEGRRKKYLSKL